MTTITPINVTYPLTEKDGTISVYGKRFLDLLLARVGGITGGIYSQLSNSSGSVTWDANAAPNAELTLVSGTNTIAPVLNIVAGLKYILVCVQPSSGSAGTISWPANFKWAGGTAPTLSSAHSAVDILEFFSDGTNIYLIAEALNLH